MGVIRWSLIAFHLFPNWIIMRKILTNWLVFSSSLFAFSESDSLLCYYPLHISNYWEYEDKFVDLMNDTTILGYFSFSVTGDTVMPNGKLYQIIERKKLVEYEIPLFDFGYGDRFYDRIDSATFNVYRYDAQDGIRGFEELLLDSLNLREGEFLGYSRWFEISALISIENQELDPEKFYAESIKSFCANDIVSQGFMYALAKGFGFVSGLIRDTTWRHTIELVYAQIDGKSFGIAVSVPHENKAERTFQLYQNYPNPFNGDSVIEFDLQERENVELNLYNTNGQLIQKIYAGYLDRGSHQFKFSSGNLPSGIYIYTLKSGSQSQSKKSLILK